MARGRGGGTGRRGRGPGGTKPAGARPVLGNDPFERGAALREPVVARTDGAASRPEPAVTPAPTPTPTAAAATRPLTSGTRPPPRTAIGAVEQRVDELASAAEARLFAAAARLRALAAEEAAGQHAHDLAQVVARLGPALRERLAALAAVRRLFDGPGPLDDFGMDAELVARAAPVLDFLVDGWWRAQVRGAELLPAGPAVIVANHGGRFHWDALVLAHVLRRAGRDCRPLLDEHAVATPIAGRASVRLGAVPATPEHALKLLASGAMVAVFPEGSRSGVRPWPERYRIRRFGRGGFARIAIVAGAPVIPCAIVGSEETAAPVARPGFFAEALGLPLLGAAPGLPVGPFGLVPLPSRWTVRFGAPLAPPAGATPDDASAIGALAERVRDRLQAMIDEEVASRRSVYL